NPTFGFGLDRDADPFNPFRLTEGRWAQAPGEVVIDKETASRKHFAPGDAIRVAADGPVRTFQVVGVATFGDVNTLGGATFAIFTTLSITVAQRSREFATLRTLGASRRHVLRSVILESLAIGLTASIVGLGLGVGLAKGMSSLLSATGLSLPQASLVFAGRTVLVSLVVGVAVTLAAGLLPAFKATRVPPIAAVREGAILTGRGRRR